MKKEKIDREKINKKLESLKRYHKDYYDKKFVCIKTEISFPKINVEIFKG